MITDVTKLIEKMSHDELRDFIDYCEYHYLSRHVPASDFDSDRESFLKMVRNRRAGLPTGGFPDEIQIIARDTKILNMTTPLQKQARDFIRKASKTDLNLLFGEAVSIRSTAGAIAWALLRAKAPVKLNSKGNIQVKWISYEQAVRDADGKIMRDENGNSITQTVNAPFLYLRYWTVQGDSDRKMKRLQSMYIGGSADGMERLEGGYIYRDLTHYIYDIIQQHGIERSRTIRKTGEVQTYKVRPKNEDNPIAEFEARIMACIDMSGREPIINHECLEALQTEIMSSG